MNFSVLPPEVNSMRIFSGAGSGPMLSAAKAWNGLAAELGLAATAFGTVTSELAGGPWQGPSAAAMAVAAAPYTSWLSTTASWAEHAATQATTLANEFELVRAAMVQPALLTANRSQLVSLVFSNLFGQNAPAIAAAEAEYEQMWARDVAAMAGYHAAASAVGEQLMPWLKPPNNLSEQTLAASSGETRITVPMSSPLDNPSIIQQLENLTPSEYAALNEAIGENWFPGTTPEVVNYPATIGFASGKLSAPNANTSIQIGQLMLNTDIFKDTANGRSVVVAGHSMGSIVIDREEAYLATDPNAPSPSQLTFVEFANPERGLAHVFFPVGTTVPAIGYTSAAPPVSQYNTAVVYHQYEGFSDPPDRPWHLLADVNAIAGVAYDHIPTEYASQADVVEVSSVTDALGGTTTTYLIPATTLPLLTPLQRLGVPTPIVSDLNTILTPIVNEGYSEYDPTGGPHLLYGKLVD